MGQNVTQKLKISVQKGIYKFHKTYFFKKVSHNLLNKLNFLASEALIYTFVLGPDIFLIKPFLGPIFFLDKPFLVVFLLSSYNFRLSLVPVNKDTRLECCPVDPEDHLFVGQKIRGQYKHPAPFDISFYLFPRRMDHQQRCYVTRMKRVMIKRTGGYDVVEWHMIPVLLHTVRGGWVECWLFKNGRHPRVGDIPLD